MSVNEVICHGIPDTRPFAVGDIVNIDVTLYYGGYHGDLNDSYIVADLSNESGSQYLGIANTGISDIKSSIENEKKSPSFIESVRLVECARECLRLALCEVYPGKPFRELGNVIDAHAKSCGFSVVRNFCGHGIGRVFHGAPMIPHYANNKASGVMRVGNVFTIEPMINAGNWRDTIWPDNWTAVTVDGSRSAQFEHTILVTSTGCEVLTAASGEKRYYSSLSFSS